MKQRTDAAPAQLQSIPNLQQIPLSPDSRRQGIYFLCRNGKVVYVGQSVCVFARIGNHLSTKDFDSAYFVQVPVDDLDTTEWAYIDQLGPEYNSPDEKRLRRKKTSKPDPNEPHGPYPPPVTVPPSDTVVGIREICTVLSRDRKSVYWLIKHDYLKAWKAHDRWETTKADLQAYIAKHRKETIHSLQKGRK